MEKNCKEPTSRFPAYHHKEMWKEYKLGDIAQLYKGKGISKNDVSDNGAIPCIRYGELYTHYKEIIDKVTSYTDLPIDDLFMSKANDVIIPSSGETKEDIATASCVLYDNVALGGDINVIRTSNNGVFLSYYLNNAKKHDIAKIAQGISIIHLYNEQLRNLSIELPNLEEQQKIAECLSSIDSYISSVNEKVELLKVQKKSLMQKLFPQKGNTIPEYRFPEFAELGMWTEKTLGDIGDVCMCKRIMKDETNINYSIPFYKIGTFGKKADTYITEEQFNEYKAKYSYPQKGDILFSAAGTIGRYVEFDGKPAYFQDSNIVWIANDETLVCNKFLKYLYSKVQWNIDDGGVVKRLYNDSIKKTSIQIPSMPEQRKIAECLSSIDEAIRFYSEKVSQLEQHKKGLMQQLFPKAY